MGTHNDELEHYGTPRHSGRYPWGSGKNPQRSRDMLTRVKELKKEGMSEKDIAKSLFGPDATTTTLRTKISIATAASRKDDYYKVTKLKNKGMSVSAISKQTGIPWSTCKSLLDENKQARNEVEFKTAELLKEEMKEKPYLDIGKSSALNIGVSQRKFDNAIEYLKEEGYTVTNVQIPQLGTQNKTTIKVLAPKGSSYSDVKDHILDVKSIQDRYISENSEGEKVVRKINPPVNIDGKRVYIRYAENGGLERDGTMEIRRNVPDLDMGTSRYAQVRIGVDGKSYLKGIAIYSDDIPKGYDIVFNTNKKEGTPPEKVFKPQKDDPNDKFGALISRQNYYTDKNGKEHQGALNIVREEGEWSEWSDSLASQMLSKQSYKLAREQLDLDYKKKQNELAEINSLTNPVLKKTFLDKFAQTADGAAVHLKAAALPGQKYHVILPLPDMPETEIYAPKYKDGTSVVLIRYPHGGTFEIPRLTVNNKRSKIAKNSFPNAADAVGINSKVAEQLSGADFDGDTVIVIPDNDRRIKNSEPLQGLKNFDPKIYSKTSAETKTGPKNEGGDGFRKGLKMGQVSNLISDMSIKGAEPDELARAVRHSMVVIDAQKHNLNWKQSAIDNDIRNLEKKYQAKLDKNGRPIYGGSSTLISRASGEVDIEKFRVGGIDPETGKIIKRYDQYRDTKMEQYNPETGKAIKPKRDPNTGEWINDPNAEWRRVRKTVKSKRALETEDLRTLSSGTEMEDIYADYGNKCKALANEARKLYISTKTDKASTTAKNLYAKEYQSLKDKLIEAEKNDPLERQAQIVGNKIIEDQISNNPSLETDKEALSKARGKAIIRAREMVGAKRKNITFTDREWEAIQAGAITPTMQKKLFDKADLDKLRERAMPKNKGTISTSKQNLIKAYNRSGYTQAEIAEALNVSVSTVSKILIGKE